MDNKELNTENLTTEEVVEIQDETKEINIDPLITKESTEPVSTKKTFRITQTHKEMSEKLEAESNSDTANEYFGKLLKAFIEVNNMDGAVYTQDYRKELIEHLTRTVEIFDQIEKRNELKRSTYMSRSTDKINELTTTIEELNNKVKTITEEYQKEITSINDKYVMETSQLNLKVKQYEEQINKSDKKIADLESELDRHKKELKELEGNLAESIREQSQAMNIVKEKDRVIQDLSEENRELNKKALDSIQELNKLERENRDLQSQVTNLTDKINTTVNFQNQQKELYEEQIKAYKDMISNKK